MLFGALTPAFSDRLAAPSLALDVLLHEKFSRVSVYTAAAPGDQQTGTGDEGSE
jgi:hypothetical protein